ncbi:histidine kinase [Salipaludibacillus agaradhaerens]|uniref:Histidine kinase n=1 Tax=Salipaludibacillus agaradhaerens TaxID=76935 RepID=A0A9Q4B3D6_SALAG|nr:histidine kinase [Salipaludibacillus agaradhaerens]MCR6097526.1 histidine kinase [Salipaludibacillus agaradhaerens]MCR6112990.1 histidine kinase [Salipaludibacillus agaradhaerens]
MKSIHSRLLIMLFICIIIPYFLSVVVIYGYTKSNVEHHELENTRDYMQRTSEDLQQYFQDIINLPYILYRDHDLFQILEYGFENSIHSKPTTIEKSMETFYLMRNEFRQVRFYIAAEEDLFTVYNATVSARSHQPDLLQEDAIQRMINSDSNYMIEPPRQIENYNNAAIIPESDDSMVLTIHHQIEDVLSNELLGIITVNSDLDEYARICERLIQNDQEAVLLVNADNYVMYASDPSLIGKPVPDEYLQSHIGEKEHYVNDDIILSNTLSESGPLEGWQLVKITPSHVLFNEVRQTAYTNIMVGVGVVLLGLMMISIISYKITRPIKLLSRKVRRIEGDNMESPFEDNQEDEIGHLEKHMKEMMTRINFHIEREYKLEIENRKNQLKALKSQVHPHFLYNSLQSIGAVALRSNSPQVYQLITSLSKMMRYTIRADHWVTVRTEVDYVKAYMALQKERFRTHLSYAINIDDNICDISVPSMILQPLVENFFKHCYEKGFSKAHLDIYSEIRGDCLYLTVENDGPTLSDEELTLLKEKIYFLTDKDTYSYEHIGLKNIHDRLVLNYGPPAGIELDTMQKQGFSVRLIIPLLAKEDEQYESIARG